MSQLTSHVDFKEMLHIMTEQIQSVEDQLSARVNEDISRYFQSYYHDIEQITLYVKLIQEKLD